MPRHGWRASGAVALAAAALLLAACGEDPAPAADEAASQPSSSSEGSSKGPSKGSTKGPATGGARRARPAGPGGVTGVESERPTPDAEEQALADLAAAAQQAAEQQRSLPKGPALGADISWPQCSRGLGIPQRRTLGMPMPLPAAGYVVVGLTNGPGFTPNPCLADQVRWVRSRDLLLSAYAVASFPSPEQRARYGEQGPYDGATAAGALRNAGYQQARYTVSVMQRAGMDVPAVWVDVEPVPDFDWSGDRAANAAVVEGVARGYADAGYLVGVYSTPALWTGVVGDLALGLPEWRAAGQTSRAEAVSRCSAEWVIQGGAAVMGQWVEQSRDQNVTCPGAARELSRFFSR